MKPKNFPGRKQRRQQRAQYRSGDLPLPPPMEPVVDDIRFRVGAKKRLAKKKKAKR